MKLFAVVISVMFFVASALSQGSNGVLATLIENGTRKVALERIRTASAADINDPQPDGSRPIHW